VSDDGKSFKQLADLLDSVRQQAAEAKGSLGEMRRQLHATSGSRSTKESRREAERIKAEWQAKTAKLLAGLREVKKKYGGKVPGLSEAVDAAVREVEKEKV
jgi:hypothetical protein